MLYNAVMIAEGEMEPTANMSYVDAWQHLVDTGEVWKLQRLQTTTTTPLP